MGDKGSRICGHSGAEVGAVMGGGKGSRDMGSMSAHLMPGPRNTLLIVCCCGGSELRKLNL